MRIALFCTNEFAIPLRDDIIYAPLPLFEALVLGLAEKGHEVFLYAPSNSALSHKNITHISGDLISFDKAEYKNMWGAFHDQEVLAICQQLLIAQLMNDAEKYKFDVIHLFHSLIHALPFALKPTVPIIATLHDPLNDKREFLLRMCQWRNNINYVSISNNQRLDFPTLNYASTVYNGINTSLYTYNDTPEDYFVFLGRISPEKGAHIAVQAAHKARVKLKLIGPNMWSSKEFWEKEIVPYLNKDIVHIDQLPQHETRPYLAKAKALLFPIQWQEPFGLVMIEAMASGTPVIAFNRGSVKEVVTKDTGSIVENIDEMVEAMKKIGTINRKKCHQHVETHFTQKNMVEGYENIYIKLAQS